MRDKSCVESVRAEAHPVGLHVTGGVAQLPADSLVDVGLEDVVAQLDGFVSRQRGRHSRQTERHQSMTIAAGGRRK